MRWLLAAASGVLYFLGYPGFDLWPLALVALAPLIFAIDRERSLVRAALLGLLCGVVLNAGGYSFLLETLRTFAGFGWVVCTLVFLLFCVVQGAQVAVFALVLAWLHRRGRDPLLWAAPVWVALELGYPLIFPTYLASALHSLGAPSQVAELGGPTLLSLLVVATNAVVAALLRQRGGGRVVPRVLLVAGPVGLALCVAYGLVRMPQVESRVQHVRETLEVGLVQANMGLIEKRTDRTETRRRHIELSRALERRARPSLLIWPESAIATPIAMHIEHVDSLLGSLATPVLFGALSHETVDGRARLYNSAVLADVDGKVQGRVHKRRLLPFAEYIPLGESFPALYDWSANSGRLTPGDGSTVLQLGSHRIGVSICYEDLLPGIARAAVADGAELLINVTNDAWFGDSRAARIHLVLSKLRAIETRRALVRATNSGISAVIGPSGAVLRQTGTFERTTLAATVPLLDGTTPFVQLGHWPAWLCLLALMYAALVRPGSTRPTSPRGSKRAAAA